MSRTRLLACFAVAANDEDLAKRLGAFLADPPAGYYPPEKLTTTLERVRAQGVDGVVVFSTGGLTSAKLWEALGAFFGK